MRKMIYKITVRLIETNKNMKKNFIFTTNEKKTFAH